MRTMLTDLAVLDFQIDCPLTVLDWVWLNYEEWMELKLREDTLEQAVSVNTKMKWQENEM